MASEGWFGAQACTLCGAEVHGDGKRCADCLATVRFHMDGRSVYGRSSTHGAPAPHARHTPLTRRLPHAAAAAAAAAPAAPPPSREAARWRQHTPPPAAPPYSSAALRLSSPVAPPHTHPLRHPSHSATLAPPLAPLPPASTPAPSTPGAYSAFVTSPSPPAPPPSGPPTSPPPTSPPPPLVPPVVPPVVVPPTSPSAPPPTSPSAPPPTSPSQPGAAPALTPAQQYEAQLAAQVQLAFESRKKSVGKLGFKSAQVRVVAPDQVMMVAKPPMLNSPTGLTRMQMYMQQMLASDQYADVFFEVGGELVHGHKAVLANHSPVFRALFAKFPDYRAVIPIADTRPAVFRKALKFVYMEQTEVTLELAMELLPLTAWLQLRYLHLLCAVRLAQHISAANAAWVYEGAVRYSVAPLCRVALQFIIDNFDDVSRTRKFQDLDREPLVAIISARAAALS